MDDPSLFDQQEADRQAIAALIREIKRRYPMLKLAIVDGALVRMHAFEKVSREEAEKLLADLRAEVAHIESLLSRLPAAAPAQPAAPAEPAAPAQPEAPAAPEAPAPAAPETPAAPAADPNAGQPAGSTLVMQ